MCARGSLPAARTIVVAVDGSLGAGTDGPGLCERLRARLAGSDADQAVIDVAAITEPDVATVDALARVLLTAQRLGREVRVRHASRELQELLALVGLDDVVALERGSGLEARGQTEHREQSGRVEEEVEPDDPTG